MDKPQPGENLYANIAWSHSIFSNKVSVNEKVIEKLQQETSSGPSATEVHELQRRARDAEGFKGCSEKSEFVTVRNRGLNRVCCQELCRMDYGHEGKRFHVQVRPKA